MYRVAECYSLINDSLHVGIRGYLRGADLQQIHVCVYHGVAEVALDVSHGLALDLQPVAHPQSVEYLVESSLKQYFYSIKKKKLYKKLIISSDPASLKCNPMTFPRFVHLL